MPSSLRTYVEKRNFKKTAEPRGKVGKKRSTNLMFVVQEHHASHLHWDFRLEWEGVLKSWAVPKGPSLDPHSKRLAVETEDHPMDYGDFEGIIPQDEYGGGEVYVWDTGTWNPIKDAEHGFRKGHLEFELKGKRLKGAWTLVRTKTPSRMPQWLLIKRTDQHAVEGHVAEEIGTGEEFKKVKTEPHKLKKASLQKVQKAAAKSSPKVSAKASKKAAAESTATAKSKSQSKTKSARKAPPLEFIEPMLAQLVEDAPPGEEWLHETKFDGYRLQMHVEQGDVHIYTRSSQDWTTKFPTLRAACEKLDVEDAILDGEAVVLDPKGRSDFQRLQNSIKMRDSKNLYYYAFDILRLNGESLLDRPLIERKELLKKVIGKKAGLFRYSEHIEGQGPALFKESCKLGLEGIISKQADSTYMSGRRGGWLKSKCGERQEFVIAGYTDAEGSRTDFGALLLGIYEGKKLRYVGRVGTGFNAQSLKQMGKLLRSLEQEESPFDLKSPKGRGLHFVKPEKMAEVSFANWTSDKILRTPVFHGLREDKDPTEILQEKAQPVRKAAASKAVKEAKAGSKPAASKRKTASPGKSAAAESLNISNPDRVVYPDDEKTKQDIALYYLQVAPRMLEHLSGRPLSLVRFPEGAAKGRFFQKHIHGKAPAHIEEVEIKEKENSRYMVVNTPEGLMDLVQMGAFELHVWNCHQEDVEAPDQFIMDLDPGPGVTWNQIKKSAVEMRDLLEELGLKSFIKVSGGKGVHLHVPIVPEYSWDQVKNFSKAIAQLLEDQNPELYVSTMSKKIRNGKIFVDYLRNGRGATAVAAYSLRARDQSSCAMPITWEELKALKAPDQFTIDKALAHLKKQKKDPWQGYFKLKQKLPKVQ